MLARHDQAERFGGSTRKASEDGPCGRGGLGLLRTGGGRGMEPEPGVRAGERVDDLVVSELATLTGNRGANRPSVLLCVAPRRSFWWVCVRKVEAVRAIA